MAKRAPARNRPPDDVAAPLDVEDALVTLVRAGDGEAARCLSNACEPWLRRRAERHLPLAVRRRVGVSDVVQDALAAALLGLDRFEARGPDAFQRWVGRILDHKVRDALRAHARRRRRGEREAPDGAEGRIAARTPTPSVVALGTEARQALAAARTRLPAAEQEVVRLLDDEALPPAEAARRMGRSADAVRRLHGRAIARLRRTLVPTGGRHTLGRTGPRPPTTDDTDALIGSRLGPWQLGRHLGSGATGSVFEAQAVLRTPYAVRGTRVALKVFSPAALLRSDALARFRAEAALGRRIRHPNVVRMLGSGSARSAGKTRRFIACELVRGRTLRSWLDADERLGESVALHLAREVARGLAAIHAAGGVHRDVKPENVLVTPDENVRLVDLGFATDPDRADGPRSFDGSLAYAAPEQWTRGSARIDGRADLYALGVMLYEAATGRHPFGDRTDLARMVSRRLESDPPPPSSLDPLLTPRFDTVVRALLQRDPDERPPSAEAFLDWLDGRPDAWRPRSSTARPFATPAWDLGPAPRPFRGRERELEALDRAVSAACAGKGTATLLSGSAGIGKTRLAAEAAALLRRAAPHAHLLRGTAAWHEPPADPIAGAFRAALGDAFGDLLRRACPDAPALARAYEAWACGRAPEPDAPPLPPAVRAGVAARAISVLSEDAPVLFVLEDLHDATETSLLSARALVRAIPSLRVAVLLTCRRIGTGRTWQALTADPLLQDLTLDALPRSAIEAIFHDHAAPGAAPALDPDTLARAGGNPFVTIELARAGASSRTAAADARSTETLRQVVLERLQRLGDGERDALSAGACEGESFDPALVGDALGLGPVEALRRFSGLHREHGLLRAEGDRYRFDHPAVPETLVASLPPPLVRAYHAALARALEQRAARAGRGLRTRGTAVHAALARHRFASGNASAGWEIVRPALRWLHQSHAHAQLLTLAGDALATQAPDEQARLEVLFRAVDACRVLGRSDVERARLDEAMAIAERLGDLESRLLARRGLAWHLVRRGEPAPARELLQAARALAQQSGSVAHEIDCDVHLGNALLISGSPGDALATYRSCAVRARAARRRTAELQSHVNAATALVQLNRFEEAATESRKAVALLTPDLSEEAPAARGNLAVALAFLGHVREAEREFRWALARSTERGDLREASVGAGNLGALAREEGRFADALAYGHRALADGRMAGESRLVGHGLLALGEVLRWIGDTEGTLRAVEEASRSPMMKEDAGERAWARHALGLVRGQAGEHDAARTALEEALAGHRAAQDTRGIGESCAALAALRLALPTHAGGEGPAEPVESAHALLAEALACARRIGSPARLATALAATALLPDADRASLRAEIRALGARVPRMPRMEARWLLWRAEGKAGDLSAARRDLAFVLAHAPSDRRDAMRTHVPLFRAVADARR